MPDQHHRELILSIPRGDRIYACADGDAVWVEFCARGAAPPRQLAPMLARALADGLDRAATKAEEWGKG